MAGSLGAPSPQKDLHIPRPIWARKGRKFQGRLSQSSERSGRSQGFRKKKKNMGANKPTREQERESEEAVKGRWEDYPQLAQVPHRSPGLPFLMLRPWGQAASNLRPGEPADSQPRGTYKAHSSSSALGALLARPGCGELGGPSLRPMAPGSLLRGPIAGLPARRGWENPGSPACHHPASTLSDIRGRLSKAPSP